MTRTFLPILLLVLVPLAGCIEVPPDAEQDDLVVAADPAPEDRIQGMTAEETRVDSAGRCEEKGIQVPPEPYCAQRVLTVTGRVGVDRLPVDLMGGNGGISLTVAPGDAWSFLATIKTRGVTEEDARRGLDTAWSWSHEDGQGGHRLQAGPTPGVPLMGPTVVSTSYVVALPAWVVLDIEARTTNGVLSLQWGEAGRVEASTTNGAIQLQGAANDARAVTTNGGIEAGLRATASGAWSFTTTNGGIHLRAPEDTRRGYAVDAATTNGRVEILLQDGRVEEESRTSKTFRTDGYDDRAIQSTVHLKTTNGGIVVG